MIRMKAVSVEDLRTRLNLEDNADTNAVLDQIIEGYTSLIEGAINRELEQKSRTERFHFRDRVLILEAPPVAENGIAKIGWQKASSDDSSFTDIDASDYYLDEIKGVITLSIDVCPVKDSILFVTYTGGFPLANGVLDFAREPRLGRAIRQALIDQASIVYQRRDSLDAAAVSAESFTEAIRINPSVQSFRLLERDFYHY